MLTHPDGGDLACCRAMHPAQHKLAYQGRPHLKRFSVQLPEGYRLRFTRVLKSMDERQPGRIAFKCASDDCGRVTEFELFGPADLYPSDPLEPKRDAA